VTNSKICGSVISVGGDVLLSSASQSTSLIQLVLDVVSITGKASVVFGIGLISFGINI